MSETASVTAKLTDPQKALLAETAPGAIMRPGPTRAALMRRGLVHTASAHRKIPGTLTPQGESVRMLVLMQRGEKPRPDAMQKATAAAERLNSSKPRPVVREPERLAREGDVVRAGAGVELYRVEKVTQEPVEAAEARLVPLTPGTGVSALWEALSGLHVVPPVAHVRTLPVGRTAVDTLADVPVAVAGAGWHEVWGCVRQIGTIRNGQRLPLPVLFPWPQESPVDWAAGCLRIGDSIVVDGRLFRVVWDGGPAEPVLKAENWHGFPGEKPVAIPTGMP